MRKERKDLVFYLGEQYHEKVDAGTSPSMKAAFEAAVREYWGGRANAIPRLSRMAGIE
jgi:hypothetical protein